MATAPEIEIELPANAFDDLIPNDQQETEEDLPSGAINFRDAMVMSVDWTVETIDGQINKGNIDLQPGFQRRTAWDDIRKSRLIESIIVGMPVPNLVLAENKDTRGKFIVIDGKQRLVSINEFINGDYKLKGLDLRNELNGKFYSELEPDDRHFLDNSTIRTSLIKNWQDENFLYTAFFRLNSGSLPLSPQELRKALIGGKLLESIEQYLSDSNAFHLVFGEVLDKRMRDSELVLRFVAYDTNLKNYRGNFKEFLNTTTQHHETHWDKALEDLNDTYIRLDTALETTWSIFGADSFKKYLGNERYERVINRAIFDCVARFFADQPVASRALERPAAVREAFHNVCLNPDFKDAVEKTPKTVGATKSRINIWGTKLAEALDMSYDQDVQRVL